MENGQNSSERGLPALSLPALSLPALAGPPVPDSEWVFTLAHTHRRLWDVRFQLLDLMPQSPRPQNISVQAVVEQGYRSEGRRRWDTQCYFCWTLEGEGVFWDERGEYRLPPDTGFLCEINDPRTGYRAEPGWRFLAFEFTGLAARAMVRDLLARAGAIYRLDPQTPVLHRLLSFETQGTAVMALDALDGAELVLELLLALAGSAREAPNTGGDLVTRAMHLIHDPDAPGVSVESVAEAVGVSREGLTRAFRRRLGRSPGEVILEWKIQQAGFLLKDTDLPVKSISARVGYTDYTNFIRAFRKVTGLTPHQFRLRGSNALMRGRL